MKQVKFNRFWFPNELYQRIFGYPVKTFDRVPTKIGYFFRMRRFFEMNKNKSVDMNFALLIWCSDKTSFPERLIQFLTWKVALEHQKFLIFNSTKSKCFTQYKKSFEYVHLNIKFYWIAPASLWNSTNVTILASFCRKCAFKKRPC